MKTALTAITAMAATPPLSQPGDTKNANRTLHITMSDTMRFTLATIKVKQGDTVKFLVTNIGKIKHEMVMTPRRRSKNTPRLCADRPAQTRQAFPLPVYLPYRRTRPPRTAPGHRLLQRRYLPRLYPSTSSVR
ncbi:cupredoxin domain-containing protein [Sulfuriferula plumbiphila]|uniref:cupredoxin domain-containing protein n=1 Tax=Sulfuriferula plumbiphila TaxID=171865 RepID=UPI0011BF07CC|nr:hypothetical protein [Sulfuriferula plumbiphila]